MTVVFDLDYTLFNTKQFKEKLPLIFGMTIEEFSRSYHEHFKSKGVNYNLEKHSGILKKEGIVKSDEEMEEIKKNFNDFIKGIDSYLYKDAEEVLKQYHQHGDKLILASFGDIGWQKKKIENLKIKDLFDQIVCEDSDKAENEFLKSLKEQEEKVLIINDNYKESEKMLEVLGDKAELRLIKGPYSAEAESKIKLYENISQLLEEEEAGKEM